MLAILTASLLFVGGCAAQTPTSSDPDAAAAQLVQTKCTMCHGIDRIKAASHDAAGWQSTIARMKAKGAQVSAAEVQTIAAYLANGGAAKL
jgi:competence protein ComEA